MAPDFARNITRIEAQLTTAAGHNDFLAGGQLAWTWAVGMPYRLLADPQGMGVMPLSPADTVRRNEHGVPEGNFEQGLGYFAALQSFLTYSFGWTRHDRGLLWWYDNGQPVEDSRFALVKAVWDADGMLLRYLAWCVDRAVPAPFLGWLGEPLHRWASKVDHEPATLSPSWRERLARETAAAESADLCATPWGKHLEHGDHIGAPSGWDWAGYGGSGTPRELAEGARLIGIDSNRHRATFVSDHVGGWYEALAHFGGQLPTLNNDWNWRIDVFVKPIGYLGQYRQSRTTGLWFAGRHQHHTVGN